MDEKNKQLTHIQEIAERKRNVHSILKRYEDEALWDSMKAKDVDPEIIEYVQYEIEMGKDLKVIRRELGIKSQTSREWIKISAALKAGYRINSAGYVVRMIGRQEMIASRLVKFIDTYMSTDEATIEALKQTDKKGVLLLDSYVKSITPLIDALSRNQKTTVEIGKALGAFADEGADKKGGNQTFIFHSPVPLPTAQQILDARKKPDVLVDSNVVKPKA